MIGADIHAPVASVAALDALGEEDAVPFGVLEKILTELLLCERRFQIVGAPLGVGPPGSAVRWQGLSQP